MSSSFETVQGAASTEPVGVREVGFDGDPWVDPSKEPALSASLADFDGIPQLMLAAGFTDQAPVGSQVLFDEMLN
mgnify:CR=1 FL=1